jgi:NitT/TauT family transport system ATP-binding protein
MVLQKFIFTHPDAINFSCFPGFRLASGCFGLLTGDNGSGKTTFFKYLKKNPGVFLPERVKKDIIVLDQLYEHLLYPYKPVWWNISLPKILQDSINRENAIEVAKHYLSSFDINLGLERYPEGLSGGEKHIVLLSRFALMQQDILLLDEPFTAIDLSRKKAVWAIIRELVETHEKGIIIATHDSVEEGEVTDEIDFDGISHKILHLKQATFR